jgi:hypothetical protein
LSANWDFQLLFILRLKQGLANMRRVFNWGGVEEVSSGLNFLHGNGWIRELFDNLQGWELFMLPVSYNATLPPANEVMAHNGKGGRFHDFRLEFRPSQSKFRVSQNTLRSAGTASGRVARRVDHTESLFVELSQILGVSARR